MKVSYIIQEYIHTVLDICLIVPISRKRFILET